jgi:Domain of unknown function (DUF4249)
MKIVKYITTGITLVLLIGICNSCNLKDYTPIVDIDIPSEAPSLVANMYLEDGIPASMFVGKTQDVLANNKNFIVNNAQINLYENEVLQSGWVKNSMAIDSTYYILPNFTPTPGNIYRTQVSASGLPTTQAADTMPLPINFTIAKTGVIKLFNDKNGGGPFGGNGFADTLVEVKLTFTDDANAKNYYRILISDNDSSGLSIYQPNVNGNNLKHAIQSTDIVYQSASKNSGGIEDGDGNKVELTKGFFTDYTFNGKQKDIVFYVPIGRVPNYLNMDETYNKAYFFVQHLSRSAYLHASSVANYNNRDGLFSQPSLIFTNYKNGFGILGCNTTRMQGIVVR